MSGLDLTYRVDAASSPALTSSDSNVLDSFATDAEADEPLADVVAAPAGAAFGHSGLRRSWWPRARWSAAEELGARAGAEIEADDAAEGLHLAARDVMSRMLG